MFTLTSFLDEDEPQTLRGGQLRTPAEAARRAGRYGPTRPLLGVPIPDALFNRGVVIQGAQGSGKSLTVIMEFIARQLERMARPGSRHKLVVVDVKGELTAVTLAMMKGRPDRPPVYLLNPFDRLSHALDPHEFATDPTRITRLVAALTHRGRDARTDEFFDSSARGHLVDLVKVLHTRRPRRWTWRDFYLIATDPDLLKRVLRNSRHGRRRTRGLVRKTFHGIVATIQSWLDQYAAAFAGMALSPPLRLEQFLRGRGVLLLTAPEDQTESLAPLARLVLRQVKDRLLADNGRDPGSHTLLVLDEFAYLEGVVPAIAPLFGRARSANVSTVCAWQSWPDVCEVHGEKRMQGIADNAAVRVWLGSGPWSADVAEKDLQKPEVLRVERGSTTSPQGESATRTRRVELRSNVLAAEVQSLLPPAPADLTVRGYVSASHLSGAVPVACDVSRFVEYLNRLPSVPAIRPRPDDELWLDPWDDVADGNRLAELFVPER